MEKFTTYRLVTNLLFFDFYEYTTILIMDAYCVVFIVTY